MGKKKREGEALALADPSGIRQELGLADPKSMTLEGEVDPALNKQAEEFVALAVAFNPEDPAQMDSRDQNIAAVENLGSKIQREAAHRSAMLKEPIRKLAARGEDGGEVANALVDL
ncbi:MAG: hypothetical protein GTO63_27750, partial [Anaerolineae bacterium]|nr:hypothetical protein [Anaerolineae bacterium]NIN98526.1 hypothetical protein [Anaerolineae bacterium]NIQ81419.1 hypothetical protein [Anaerolineae bacterium]